MLSRALNSGVFDDHGHALEATSGDHVQYIHSYNCLVVSPSKVHTATVIWLHRFGGSNKSLLPYAEDLGDIPGLEHVKFILPQARKISASSDHTRYQFVSSWSSDGSSGPDDQLDDNMDQASELINEMISQEETSFGIPSSRVVVGGTSQGSAVALQVALSTQRPLGGAFALSGCAPEKGWRSKEIPASSITKSLSYFWSHGHLDPEASYHGSLSAAKSLASELDMDILEMEKGGDHGNRDHELASGVGGGSQLDEKSWDPRGKFKCIGYPNQVKWTSSDEMDDLGMWIMEVVPGD